MNGRTTDLATQYDYGMRHPLLDEYYNHSDYFNYGYWQPGTPNQQTASEQLVAKLLDYIPQKTGLLLDVACGMGATTRYLQTHFPPSHIVGINISANQLARCQQNAPGTPFQMMDASRLGFKANSFDNVICVEAAFHFDTRERFLQEAHRILKPGGHLVLSDILFLTLPGKRRRRLPNENFVTDLRQYRSLYLRSGFQKVTIEEAREACWQGFYQALMAWGWQKRLAGEISWQIWGKQMLRLLIGNVIIRHYLLVSARKQIG